MMKTKGGDQKIMVKKEWQLERLDLNEVVFVVIVFHNYLFKFR